MRPADTTCLVIRGKPVMLSSPSVIRLRRRLGKRREQSHPLLGKGAHFRVTSHPACLILPKIKKAAGQRIVVDLL